MMVLTTMKGKLSNKKVIVLAALGFFLIGSIFLVAYFLKWPAILFPKAVGYDLSGAWTITVNVTTPTTADGQLLAQLSQNQQGRISGTVTDSKGENSRSFSGQVNGEAFQGDQTRVVATLVSPVNNEETAYEADIALNGTITSQGGKISGRISGQVFQPSQGPLSGTFFALKTGSSPPPAVPTATPVPTNTPIPTATPVPQGNNNDSYGMGAGNSPTPTPTPTRSYGSYSSPTPTSTSSAQLPVSGNQQMTFIFIGVGLFLLLFSFALQF